jgi:hypothetical protein
VILFISGTPEIDIFEAIDDRVLFTLSPVDIGHEYYRKKDIVANYKNHSGMILLVEELCKKHPHPTLIDVRDGKLNILRDGKMPADEIKSLYFLDDSES